MIAFLVGFIVGFLMCIPIGPINVWVMNTYVRKGFAQALSIAFGGSVMDLIYFFIILSGISLFTVSEHVIFYLKVSGIILIFLIGLKEFFSVQKEIAPEDNRKSPSKIIAGFILGVVIYTSNPTLIITMTALGAFIKSLELFPFDSVNISLVSIGLASGSFLWFVFLISIVARYKAKIRDKYLKKFVKISGLLMIGLSIYMGISLI